QRRQDAWLRSQARSLTSDRNRGKLQLRVNADQRTARWRRRTEIADETIPGAELDMTDAAGGAIHEHRTDRSGEWIRHRQSFESVIANELLCGVSSEFGFRAGIDNTGSEQCVFYIMPAAGARMRMGAFLRNRRRLHQPAIDMPIDLGKRVYNALRIILRDDRSRFLFALRVFEAEMESRPSRRAYAWLIHGSHRLYGKCS